jgi:hypothetical protein
MTPQEKAKELVDKFEEFADDMECNVFTSSENRFKNAKQCALIAVDEIINSNPHSNPLNTDVHSTMSYWQEVKQEIENYEI